jgi:hypothetical protein
VRSLGATVREVNLLFLIVAKVDEVEWVSSDKGVRRIEHLSGRSGKRGMDSVFGRLAPGGVKKAD